MNHTSIIRTIGGLGIAGLITACAGLPMPGTTGTTSALQGYEWQVQTINGVAVNTTIHPTMLFGSTMNLTGHTSCNTYVSGYVSTGQMLLIKKGVSTKMACVGDANNTETKFLNQLSNTQMWSIDSAGVLTLTGSMGTITATHK